MSNPADHSFYFDPKDRRPIDFDDAGATDDEPVKGIVMGDIRGWHDQAEDLQQCLQKTELILTNSGFRRCDIAACNCGSWHQVGGFKARFDEIKEVVEDAGYSTNGRVLLDAVKQMVFDLERLGSALEPFVALRDQSPSEMAKVIHKDLDGIITVTLTVTKDQFNAARRALKFKRI